MSEFAVQQSVAAGLIRFYLSGFRGYPPSEAGENVFARGLQESCLSVQHVTATLKSFDERFPTLRELLDVANALRPQFEPKENLQEKWEREYGKPQPFDMSMEGKCQCCGRPWADIMANSSRVRNGEIKGGCCAGGE